MGARSPARGDVELAAIVDQAADCRARRLAVVVVDHSGDPVTRSAFIDCDRNTAFEIGSVTKAMTGMLIADCIDRREFRADATLGDISDTLPVALHTIRLDQLGTHTSGLPTLPGSLRMRLRTIAFAFLGTDPYRGIRPHQVIAAAAQARRDGDLRYRYSNLGAALVGNVIAAARDCDYATLLHDRLLLPLGMADTSAAVREHTVRSGWRNGRRQRAWKMDGYAPAGGVVSTPGDIGRWLHAILSGTAPGMKALDTLGGHHGWFWVRGSDAGQPWIWHNGETGGYSSFVAIYPDANRAIAVLANTTPADTQQRIATQVISHLAR